MVVLTLALMDRSTVDSLIARPRNLPAVDAALAARLDSLGVRDMEALKSLLAGPEAPSRLGISTAGAASPIKPNSLLRRMGANVARLSPSG
jgi:hypothetical protein